MTGNPEDRRSTPIRRLPNKESHQREHLLEILGFKSEYLFHIWYGLILDPVQTLFRGVPVVAASLD